MTYTPRFHVTDTPTAVILGTATFTSTPSMTPIPTLPSTPSIFITPFVPYTLRATLTPYIGGRCPVGVAAGAGFIAVSDQVNNVQVFDSNGNWLYNIAANMPNGMAIDSAGELYIAQITGGVVGYMLGTPNCTYDYTWSGQGKMIVPMSVRIDSNGNLVVPDEMGMVWNLAWEDDSVLRQTTGGPSFVPQDAALDASGYVYAAGINGANHGIVSVFNSQYQYVGPLNESSWAVLLGSYPSGIGVDLYGNLLITDTINSRVVYATTQGQYLGEIDGFNGPTWLCVTPAGELFIPDHAGCVVDKYTE